MLSSVVCCFFSNSLIAHTKVECFSLQYISQQIILLNLQRQVTWLLYYKKKLICFKQLSKNLRNCIFCTVRDEFKVIFVEGHSNVGRHIVLACQRIKFCVLYIDSLIFLEPKCIFFKNRTAMIRGVKLQYNDLRLLNISRIKLLTTYRK